MSTISTKELSNSRYLLYLKTGGVGGKVFAQTAAKQGCLAPSAWMESLSLRANFAANTLPHKEKQTGNSCKESAIIYNASTNIKLITSKCTQVIAL